MILNFYFYFIIPEVRFVETVIYEDEISLTYTSSDYSDYRLLGHTTRHLGQIVWVFVCEDHPLW